jgi:hypothetical protein
MAGRLKCERCSKIPATCCKYGHRCDSCAQIEKDPPYVLNKHWRECAECKRCTECALNLHKESIPHPTDQHKKGKLTHYCTIRSSIEYNGKVDRSVSMTIDPYKGTSYYLCASEMTKAVICDHLDKYGLLNKSEVPLPSGYIRRMKYVKRDAPPIPRTSNRPAGHKQEHITCFLKMCEDRRGNCECLCRICMRYSKECGCCKKCGKKKRYCDCNEEKQEEEEQE